MHQRLEGRGHSQIVLTLVQDVAKEEADEILRKVEKEEKEVADGIGSGTMATTLPCPCPSQNCCYYNSLSSSTPFRTCWTFHSCIPLKPCSIYCAIEVK